MSTLSDTLKNIRLPYCTAVIVAGGSSVRFGADKLFAPLSGRPVLAWSIEAFSATPCIRELVVVTRPERMEAVGRLASDCAAGKPFTIVPGGDTRAQSAFAGVFAASRRAELIAIHDGARPLVTGDVILNAVYAAMRSTAAAPAVPLRDTVRRIRSGVVLDTPPREELFAVQTPQVFRAVVIKAALTDAVKNAPDVTDDCAAAERIGARVTLTAGNEENLKITTPLDLALAEIILQRRRD